MERKLAETNIVGQARRLPEKNSPRITRIDANFLKSQDSFLNGAVMLSDVKHLSFISVEIGPEMTRDSSLCSE
ncbi:MAG: hypothetical protein DME78_00375 [Verrucomicrobia bacterium]|nr:MAG: hypothetical protein DME78_00375 [Verrucomicrobiota bacterium]